MKKSILIIAILISLFSGVLKAQPPKQEKQYFVPFTIWQLKALNQQMRQADSAMVNNHNLMPSISLLRSMVEVFNSNYNQQLQAELDARKKFVSDSLGKVKPSVK